jgi:hypothetical protein
MSINIDNYELFVIDYLDGNLDEVKAQEMEIFLLLNPAIAEDIEGLEDVKLHKELIEPLDSAFIKTIKKQEISSVNNITEENYEHFFIASMENDLQNNEADDLQLFLKENTALHIEFEQQQSAKFEVDKNIVFANKDGLKKERKKVFVLWPTVATIAAAVLLAFWLFKPDGVKVNKELLGSIDSHEITSLKIESSPIILPKGGAVLLSSINLEYEKPKQEIARRELALKSLKPNQSGVQLADTKWKNEMLLMQSFANDRTQLYSQIDLDSFSKEERNSPFRVISSLLWKTTKGQIKNMSKDIIQDEYKFWQAGKIEALTDGFISVKTKSEE